MKRLTMTSALLFIGFMFVGCYTQFGGYYEAPRPAHRVSNYRQERDNATERTQEENQAVETENRAEEREIEEDEEYYGRHKPTYDDYVPYDYDIYPDSYYREYYPPYPYYGGYHPFYPYDDYYGGPYYGYYGRYRYYDSYHGYPRHDYRNSDFHHDRQRSQSYRGVDSPRPSLERPRRDSINEKSNNAPAHNSSDSSDSRYRRSPRSERRR